tara:strand:- start:490 stop:705 length:216 start_codon:yes stop_codon:yes gene_type:complete
MTEQQLIGAMVAGLAALGLYHHEWLLEKTRKGQLLVRWFGKPGGIWVLRGVLFGIVAFGVLLACDVIRPMR